jgi:hypothetical protein
MKMEKSDIKNLEKTKNRIDMMVSMHSELVTRYSCRTTIIDAFSTLSSVILLSFVFIDYDFIAEFNMNTNVFKLIVGLCTIVGVFLTVLSNIVDWKGKKTEHKRAFDTLVQMKNEWCLFLSHKGETTPDATKFLEEKTNLLISQLISIDNAQFNKLKQKHCQKVIISKFLSEHPFAPIWILRFKYMIQEIIASKNFRNANMTDKTNEKPNEKTH